MNDIILYIRRFGKWIYKKTTYRPIRTVFKNTDTILKKINKGKIVIARRNGIVFELELNQLIDSEVFYNGAFEPITTKAIQKFVRPGMTAFDIGANVGWHTLNLATLVGQKGRVYAFEPTEWAIGKLKKNLSLNSGFNNVIIEGLALSDIIEFKKHYRIRSRWDVEGRKTAKEEGYSDFMTLDTYCEEKSINKIDFIKIDVDGYECKIIKGGLNTLKKSRPILVIEMGDYWLRSAGDNIENLVVLLDSIGYTYLNEDDFSEIKDIISFVKSIECEKTVNVICIPE
jgi:FkbM family methyltransferase